MDTLKRCITGEFERRELRGYVAFEAALFWGLIFVCWLIYPKEHHYSIMTHTFSFLGSFASKHNPQGWWLFSIAMLFWALATVPLVFYLYRRFATSSLWGARAGAFLLLLGGVGIAIVALFPDARGEVIGHWEWTEIHEKGAILVAIGFVFGITWHGLLLVKDRVTYGAFGRNSAFNHKRLAWPYLFWFAIFGVGMYFQIKWEFVYAEMKAAAQASGERIGSHWSAALNTRYSFPLWENLVIYALFAFLIWFALAVPEKVPGSEGSGTAG